MATGDLNDFRSRIKATLPRWFADSSPILDAMLSGVAQALSFVYSLYLYAQMQTRIKMASDGWLDLIAGDFFGTRIARKANQTDASFRAIIIANLFRERATRKALIQVLTDLTGRAPVLIEPQQPGDTGAYGGTDAITISSAPQVYRSDWQGNQLLYPTARTNYTRWSQDFTNTGTWQRISLTLTPNTDVAPDGTLTMGTLTGTAATTSYLQQQVFGLSAATVYTVSMFLKQGTAASNLVRVFDNSISVFQAGVIVNWSGGVPFLSSASGWAVAPAIAATPTPGLFLFTAGVSTAALTGLAVLLYPSASNAAESVKAWGVNLKPGVTYTSYIPTTTAAVTTTDYTIDSAGNIVFAQAPLSGAVLSWSGTYLNARTSQTVSVAGLTFANGDGFSTAFSVAPKYGYPCGYGVAGYYGSQLLPSQMFLIAYRPASAGIPNIAGYGNPQGAYRTPPVSMYGSLSMIQGQVTDADIYAAIDSVKPVGTVIWTTIKS